MTKINSLQVSVAIGDAAGRVARGAIDPYGMPELEAIATFQSPAELVARFASMAYLNGTKAEELHLIVNEGIGRAESWLRHNHRSPAK
jgi:hypothetical protein